MIVRPLCRAKAGRDNGHLVATAPMPGGLAEVGRFTDLEEVVDNVFNNLVRRSFFPTTGLSTPSTRSLHPFDVIETDKAYELHADAPGLTPEEITVELHEGILTVSGEHKTENKTKDETGKVWRQERTFTKFSRQFTLPQNAIPDQVSAKLDKGVLTVVIAKRPEEEKPAPQKIHVVSE